MLPVTQMRSATGTIKYFDDHLVSSDYYTQKGQLAGQWGGLGAKRLRLADSVQRDEFIALCKNINPQTNQKLTARNVENRTVCYDFTFSVPKSVSILYSQTKDKDILYAMNEAIEKTMADIEKDAETRVRINGKNENRKTGNLVWAAFTHEEARPVEGIPDPHLHRHVIVFNATYDDKEEKWKAGQFRNLKASAHYYDALYLSRFASNLRQAGYEIERNNRDFEIAGFRRSTIDKFSNRTTGINERAEELGIIYTEDKAKLGAKTRQRKDTAKSKDEIRRVWAARLNEQERLLIAQSKRLGNASEKKNGVAAKEALDFALSHCLERKSVVERKELMIHALKRGMGSVSKEQMEHEIAARKGLICKISPEETLYTTHDALAEEKKLIAEARLGRAKKTPLFSGYQPKNKKLTKEQADAVKHALESKDFITVITGRAGTGKTWTMQEIAAAAKEKGIGFHAFAPSSSASRGVQRQEGFSEADTIATLLLSEKKQQALKGGVLWVDEAGLVGNRTMNRLIHVAKAQNARILLSGDTRQHSSVERGDALHVIEVYGGIKPAYITKIQRQKSDTYKSAVKAISSGDMETGFRLLDKMQAIKQKDRPEELLKNLALDYVQAAKSKDSVLVVAPTHSQGQMATTAIRKALKKEGVLDKDARQYLVQTNLSYTEAEKKDPVNYAPGQAIQFDQNVKGFKRGAKYDVLGRDKGGRIILAGQDGEKKKALPLDQAEKFSVYETSEIEIAAGDKIRITKNGFSNERKRLDNGSILEVKGFDDQGNMVASTGVNTVVLDKNYRNFTHGYYTTSPASQGKTVNRVLVLQTTYTGRAASKEQFYVSASRGRFEISIYTDDKEYLMRSVRQSSKRMTASELIKGHEKPSDLKKQFKGKQEQSMQDQQNPDDHFDELPQAIPPPHVIDKSKGDYDDLSL